MRVVVAPDAIAGLSPIDASEVIGSAFAESGATVAVVPLATTGPTLAEAVLQATGMHVVPVHDAAQVRAVLEEPFPCVVDLTQTRATALAGEALAQAAPPGLDELRQRWAAHELLALVPEGEATRPLTGLRGAAAAEGRRRGMELAAVLAADAEVERWAGRLGIDPVPGSGAVGGLGLLIQACGGSVCAPLDFLAERFGLVPTIRRADLVVTGAEVLDFHTLGGPVMKTMAALAGEALCPVIAIVGRNFVSARELRLSGFEAAYPLMETGVEERLASPERLSEVAAGVARTWRW